MDTSSTSIASVAGAAVLTVATMAAPAAFASKDKAPCLEPLPEADDHYYGRLEKMERLHRQVNMLTDAMTDAEYDDKSDDTERLQKAAKLLNEARGNNYLCWGLNDNEVSKARARGTLASDTLRSKTLNDFYSQFDEACTQAKNRIDAVSHRVKSLKTPGSERERSSPTSTGPASDNDNANEEEAGSAG